jgi:hypothetical protein
MANLLDDMLSVFGVSWADCCRLPALPYMLSRGRLVRRYGDEVCGALASIARAIPELPSPSQVWLGELTEQSNIDAGEAQLFAVAADDASVVLSGDKRALRTLRELESYCFALGGRIIVFEAILLVLCEKLGVETVRARLKPVLAFDTMIAACFSEANTDPYGALGSYFRALVDEVHPLILWSPENGVVL